MAITINPVTFVIYVPKADLTLIQSSPEVRELNVNWFRLQLKDLEDDPDYGIFLPKTHNHNTEVTLAGLTYARIVEIIAPYTIEFEDGQYTVNCIGANHNISDVKVPNQVSLIVNNAAGLITNAAIEYASFNGGVTVDVNSIYTGTVFPVGTPQQPVNNLSDALMIAGVRGFTTFYVVGDLTIDTGLDLGGYNFVGESQTKSELDIDTAANVFRCEFYEAHVSGVLDGQCVLKNCIVDDLNYINGVIEQCILEPGVITLGGGAEAYLLDCWSGAMSSGTPAIDMGGSGQSLIVRNYNGYLAVRNLSDPSQKVTIDLNSGEVYLESTLTAGEITVRGVGSVVDETNGATVNIDNLVNPTTIQSKVFGSLVDDSVSFQSAIKVILASLAGKATGGGTATITFRDAADSKNVLTMTVDENGNRTSVSLNP